MKYTEFENILSRERLSKYKNACSGDTKRAMTLYRHNLLLSQQMFTIISCFEVALRNRINLEFARHHGVDWLRDFVLPGGVFYYDHRVEGTRKIIEKAYNGLMRGGSYNHSKLLAEMEFGVWKFMFNNVQYRLSGRYLLNIFPYKPTSTRTMRYDNTFIFNQLNTINQMRNRIAHHEPICFGRPISIDTTSVEECYACIMQLFSWMGINSKSLLYGLDHVDSSCLRIKKI